MTNHDIWATIQRLKDGASDQLDIDDLNNLQDELRSRVSATVAKLGMVGVAVAGLAIGAVAGDVLNLAGGDCTRAPAAQVDSTRAN